MDLTAIEGSPPDLINPPSGCKFHPRCRYATQRSREEEPQLDQISANHYVACHNWQLVRADAEAKLKKRADTLEESAAAVDSQPHAKEIV
jgi:hypothetical protein